MSQNVAFLPQVNYQNPQTKSLSQSSNRGSQIQLSRKTPTEGQLSNKVLRPTSAYGSQNSAQPKYQQQSGQYSASPMHHGRKDLLAQDFENQKDEAMFLLRTDKIQLALRAIQNLVEASRSHFGRDSSQFRQLYNDCLQNLCDHSIKLLSQNLFENSIEILNTCNSLTNSAHYNEEIPEKRILVLNNLGCVYRKMGRLGKARVFLEEAYSLVQKFPQVRYSGVTYMNICAVISQAGMHDRAIQYAQQGLQECQRSLLETLNSPHGRSSPEQIAEKVKFTAICFHNIAIEEEYFKNYEKAKENFKESYLLFEEHQLELSDPLYIKFKQSYQKCVQNSLDPKMKPKDSFTIDRPKSASNFYSQQQQQQQQQQFQNQAANTGEGFYFKKNRHSSKQQQYPQVGNNMSSTQPFRKNSRDTPFFAEEANMRKTIRMNNNYMDPAEYREQQPSGASQSMRKRQISPSNLSSSASRKNSGHQESVELRKEIKEMNLIGILNWSDSASSDEEVQQNKRNRVEFLKQLQGGSQGEEESKVIESQTTQKSRSELKINLANIDRQQEATSNVEKQQINTSIQKLESITNIEKQSQQQLQQSQVQRQSAYMQKRSLVAENQQQLQKNSNVEVNQQMTSQRNSKKEEQFVVEELIGSQRKQQLVEEETHQANDIDQQQEIVDTNRNDEQITSQKHSKKNIARYDSEKSIASSESSPKTPKSVKEVSQQKVVSGHQLTYRSKASMKDLETVSYKSEKKSTKQSIRQVKSQSSMMESSKSQSELKRRNYTEQEQEAAVKIQSIWKKDQIQKQHTKKCILENKKKVIAMRQSKISSQIGVIQKFILKILAKRRSALAQERQGKERKWTLCHESAANIRREGAISQVVRDNLESARGNKKNEAIFDQANLAESAQLFSINIYHDRGFNNIKFTACIKDLNIRETYSVIQDMSVLRQAEILVKLNCQGRDLKNQFHFKFLLLQLIPFLIIKDNRLVLNLQEEGIYFQEDALDKGQENKKQYSQKDREEAALKLQKFQKSRQEKEKLKLIKEQKFDFLRKWVFVDLLSSRLFELTFMLDKQQSKHYFYLRDCSNSTTYSHLLIEKNFAQFWENADQQIGIQDYFEIEVVHETFQLSDFFFKKLKVKIPGNNSEGAEISSVQPEILYKENSKAIIMIQAHIRGKIARKAYLIMKESRQRGIELVAQEGESVHPICKMGFIYQDEEPFLFKLFYRESSNRDALLEGMNGGVITGMDPLMIIACTSLNQKSQYKVNTIRQKLQRNITKETVARYGNKVLKFTILKLARTQLKIVAPNLQLIMQEARNEILRQEGKEIKMQDPEFEGKMIFNKRTMNARRQQYKSLVNFCSFDANQSKNIQPSSIGELCKRTIYYKYHNFTDHRKVDILFAKGFKDHAALKTKALLDFPSSEFSKSFLSFMDKRRFDFEEAAPVKPKIDAEPLKSDLKCMINQSGFNLDIYFDATENNLIVVSQSIEIPKEIRQFVIPVNQIAMLEWNLEQFTEDIEDLLLRQLRQKNYVIYFEENKAMKRKQETALHAMQSNLQPSKISSVQEKKNQELEQHLQVFLFSVTQGSITIDVFIHTSEYILRINLSQKNITSAKTVIELKLTWFCCPALKYIVDEKGPSELTALFQPIFNSLSNTLDIKYNFGTQEYTCDIQETKEIMPKVLQNYFASKIQLKMLMRLQRCKYEFVKVFCSQKEILLNTDHSLSVNIYFEKRWYLLRDKFQLKVIIERFPKAVNRGLKKVFIVDLLEMKKIFTNIANSKNSRAAASAEEEEQSFLLDNKWTEIQGVHSKEYYLKIFSELIDYLNSKLTIAAMFSRIFVQLTDARIPFSEEKQIPAQKKTAIDLKKKMAYDQLTTAISAICCVQKAYRKFKRSEWQQLKAQRKKETDGLTKALGIRVKRAFKKIDGQMYIINVYQRENIYIFDLVLFHERKVRDNQVNMMMTKGMIDPSKKPKKHSIRGQYEYNSNQLLNTGALTIPEYLLERIVIQDEDIIFEDTVFKQFDPNAYQNVKRNEEENLTLNTSYDSEAVKRAIENNQNRLFSRPQPGQSNIASNLVNYQYQEDEGKSLIYNVIYTGEKPAPPEIALNKASNNTIKVIQSNKDKLKGNFGSLLQPPVAGSLAPPNNNNQGKQLPNPNERLDTEEQEGTNVVKINVDLKELKKLYPTMDSNSDGLMKIIGEQLIDGIKLNQQGQVEINQSKLNPKCIEVTENTVNMESINKKVQEYQLQQQSNLNDPGMAKQVVAENKKILLKQTRFFSKQKYLILIYIIERKIKKIVDTAFDTVFEEYEVLYQVNGINLAGKNQLPIIWEVTPEEVLIISDGIKDNMERARFLMRRIQIFNNKIIFTVLKKQHLSRIRTNPNVIIYHEQGLIPIQVKRKKRE